MGNEEESDSDYTDLSEMEDWTEDARRLIPGDNSWRQSPFPDDDWSETESEEADDPPQLGLSQSLINEHTLTMICDLSSGSGDECRICLEPLQAGERLRVLPCFHRYHCACVEEWLSRNRQCHLCKLDVAQ